ncbi:MAG: class I SAM-dependent DNA methyltransferase [Planctomycetes bacterium]|nr:class I SAM-dependent DNA methyltransferase [Planctomycetota bacterium]
MADTNRNSGITPAQFVAKWARAALPERAASHEHFIDLCRLLGQPTPAEHDATGAEFTFEKGVAVTEGASRGAKGEGGFADVWWRGKFGWEYKRKGKYRDLAEAYRQVCKYREALENPPLLVVCDIARTEIHTNFTGTAKQVHTVLLEDMDKPESLSLLRRVFNDPDSFRPTITVQRVTEQVAQDIGQLAQSLQTRGHEPHAAAHFLMKCMFCLFAEDVGLLPGNLFTRILDRWRDDPSELCSRFAELFQAMRRGGAFGVEEIPYFNGGLFDDTPPVELTTIEINALRAAAHQDWASVEPAIFGTLFERSLDPSKRAQIGAHYTSREDILLIVQPVIMAPLRRRWAEVQDNVEKLLARRRAAKTPAAKRNADRAIDRDLQDFLGLLSTLRILDPACGSGNFLYVAIQQVLDLEKEVITFAARPDIGQPLIPHVRPTQLHGLELNPYAAELAQVVIWIGYLQWMRDNGFNAPRNPVLEPLQSIECRDAILDLPAIPTVGAMAARGRAGDSPSPADTGVQEASPNVLTTPAEWPEADFIIGNPPFLGSKLFRQSGLTDEYVGAMYAAYDLPNTSDLCCYWFEQARRAIERHPTTRAGLLATQGIRGGDNRTVLQRIKHSGDIFMAWSDRQWVLDGAAVHVSMVGFDGGKEQERTLDGKRTPAVNADLSGDVDTTRVERLSENLGLGFMGDTKVGPFDLDWQLARRLLPHANPNGRSNAEAIRPWVNGRDITGRLRGFWIIDFAPGMPLAEASGFEAPFEYLVDHVKPMRKTARSGDATGVAWWIHQRPRPAMRAALPQTRFLGTPNVTKHRLFTWLDGQVLPDHQLIVFARSDDYFFGVLHSSVHELWARRMGTQLREVESGFRYTPTTCFETFALPWPPGGEPAPSPPPEGGPSPVEGEGALVARIAEAARTLNEQRERWLNPPEWLDEVAAAVDREDSFADVPEASRALLRRSAVMARAAQHKELKKRTLTALYNQRPTWLRLAHGELDRAVLAAYAAVDPEGLWSEQWADLWLDTGAGQPLPADHPLAARRAETEARVLENLLRLNGQRA